MSATAGTHVRLWAMLECWSYSWLPHSLLQVGLLSIVFVLTNIASYILQVALQETLQQYLIIPVLFNWLTCEKQYSDEQLTLCRTLCDGNMLQKKQ
jgi:hypothetical protein